MKKLVFCFFLLLLFTTNLSAKIWYMSPNGADSNNGSVGSPFLTITKSISVMSAGDTLYVRGGTYVPNLGNGAAVHFPISNLNGNTNAYFKIWAYPNEVPTFDCISVTPTEANPFITSLQNCSYVYIKGHFIFKNLKQIVGGAGISRGMTINNSNHCKIEWVEIFNTGGTGMIFEDSQDCLVLNCDVHHCADPLTDGGADAYDNSDSYSATSNESLPPNTSTRDTFRYCRGWLTSDDIVDLFGSTGIFVFDGCLFTGGGIKPWGTTNTNVNPNTMTPYDPSVWFTNSAYWGGGVGSSNGEGMKLGEQRNATTSILHFVYNCNSYYNRGTGYASNSISAKTGVHQIYNSSAFFNANDGYGFGAGWCSGTNQRFVNNWSWNNNQSAAGSDFVYDGNCTSAINHNAWMTAQGVPCGNIHPPINVSNADFLSVDPIPTMGARQSDGSLPLTNFLKLAASSDLRSAGVDVGLPFCDPSPDLGAFQFCSLPTVNIGADQVIVLPINSVSFTPIVSGATSYLWNQYSGTAGTISSTTTANTSFGNLNTSGVRGIRLCVTNPTGTVCDSALVTVNTGATAPTCSAGTTPVTITLPTSTIALNGSGASTAGNTVSYAWTLFSGSGGTITSPTSAVTTATGLTAGSRTYRLVVTDNGNGLTCTSDKVTAVNAQPVVPVPNAGIDQTLQLPTNSTSLSGSATGGSSFTYAWNIIQGIGGSLSAPNSQNTNIIGLVAGIYKVRLTVTNNFSLSASDTMQITVLALPTAPVCDAGLTPVTVTLPISFAGLSATGSSTAGNTVSFAWSQISGAASTILNPNTQNATATGLIAGTYVYRITVTDVVNGLSCTSNKTVNVNNASPVVAPIVNAGADQNIGLPTNSTTLTGTATPGTGVITGVLWQKLSGSPTGGAITSTTSLSTTITGLIAGVYRYSLTATQTGGLSAADTVTITVNSTTSGNGIKYFQGYLYPNKIDFDLGWTFELRKYPLCQYFQAQKKEGTVYKTFGANVIPNKEVVDYWAFGQLLKKGTYYFRIAQFDKDGKVYYSNIVTLKKN